MTVTLLGDRLYALTVRPHELALHGEAVRFQLRYATVTESEEPQPRHSKLLVLGIEADLPADPELGREAGIVELLRIGWELEVEANPACRAEELPEDPRELPRLLSRCAETVNDIAARAGLEAPLGPDVIDRLLQPEPASLEPER